MPKSKAYKPNQLKAKETGLLNMIMMITPG
jgi:hypothetical protein